MREKIWGARDLSPIFGPQNSSIGEAWYSYEASVKRRQPTVPWRGPPTR